jgi:translation elongation factor EF-G
MLPFAGMNQMTHLPVESFIIERLQEGGWRVIRRRSDRADRPIADFESLRDAEEWVGWRSGHSKINPYAIENDERLPPRLVEIAIEPKSKADKERLEAGLTKLAAEDPTFGVSIDLESGQTILRGVGEFHLKAKLDILRWSHSVDAKAGAPQVAFRECVTERVEHSYIHKRQIGGAGEFAAVTLVVEPTRPGAGYRFESRTIGDEGAHEFLTGVEKGIEGVLRSGVVAGFQVVDIRVELIDAKFHGVDSSTQAFEIAARACFREALQKGKSVLLEPFMRVEVVAPDDCAGLVIRDLVSRRSRIRSQATRDNVNVIRATAPLMNMFGYADALHVMSRGRAAFAMQFDRYVRAPPSPKGDPPFQPAMGMRA